MSLALLVSSSPVSAALASPHALPVGFHRPPTRAATLGLQSEAPAAAKLSVDTIAYRPRSTTAP